MKQTFTLIAALFITVIAAAQGKTKLSISIAANVATRVQVDNVKYKIDGDELLLNNLKPGNHNIKIYQLKSRAGNQGAGMYGATNNYQLVYNSNINLKPQMNFDIMINRFGKAFTDEQIIGRGNNDDDQDWGDNDNWDNGNSNNNSSYNQPMSTQAFEEFKKALKNEFINDTKEKLAKQYIAVNYFTAVQVKEILQQFYYESSKVEVAKFAYKNTVDKGNYFTVYSAFTYSSSKDELMEYIQKNP